MQSWGGDGRRAAQPDVKVASTPTLWRCRASQRVGVLRSPTSTLTTLPHAGDADGPKVWECCPLWRGAAPGRSVAFLRLCCQIHFQRRLLSDAGWGGSVNSEHFEQFKTIQNNFQDYSNCHESITEKLVVIDVSDVIGEAIRYLYLYLYSCVALYLFL